MSIIGAVTGTLAVTGIIIKFQKSVYDKKIAELQGYANQLDGHLTALQGYKNEIPGFWGDNTGDKYVRVIDQQIQQLTVARERVNDLSNLYDNLKAALDNAQNTVSSGVDEVMGIVASLTGLD